MTIKSFICGVAGTSLTPEEREFLAREQPYGVILFARNIENPAQVKALTASIRQVVSHPYLEILVDQEGGRVARLKPPHWRAYPPALELSKCADAARAVYVNARLMAQELRECGITTDCAPLADVLAPECHAIIGDRAFGDRAEQVARLARSQSEALLDGGILPVLKHIPGHGRATLDSHEALPVVTASLAALEASDFIPFRALHDLPLAMTAHILYTALDGDRVATLSPTVIQFIRNDIGFHGLLMSDDLSMKALGGTYESRAEQTLAAGCDLVLHCNGIMAQMQAVAAACTAFSEQTLARAKAAACQRRAPTPTEEAALFNEWQQLLAVA
jgi:beta-N-acetylhexosaminidase